MVTGPSARSKAQAEYAKSGMFADPMKLTPIYVRLPEAEEKRLIARPVTALCIDCKTVAEEEEVR